MAFLEGPPGGKPFYELFLKKLSYNLYAYKLEKLYSKNLRKRKKVSKKRLPREFVKLNLVS